MWVVGKKHWEKLDTFDDDDGKRQRMRKVLSRATECQMKSGKILLSASQREAVALTKEAVLIGMSNTFEVWSKEQWEKESG